MDAGAGASTESARSVVAGCVCAIAELDSGGATSAGAAALAPWRLEDVEPLMDGMAEWSAMSFALAAAPCCVPAGFEGSISAIAE
jgi:hypothetical protein